MHPFDFCRSSANEEDIQPNPGKLTAKFDQTNALTETTKGHLKENLRALLENFLGVSYFYCRVESVSEFTIFNLNFFNLTTP